MLSENSLLIVTLMQGAMSTGKKFCIEYIS